MSNVKHIIGKTPFQRRIADMVKGETGYAVPWAYDARTDHLNTKFSINKKGGNASLWVECQGDGQYVIEFEKPKYRAITSPSG